MRESGWLVVFLRGVNVGGHRRFRPSALARELREFAVVNVGAAGTLIVRRPGSRAAFRAELGRRLPFEAHVVICGAGEILALETAHPFDAAPLPGIVQFVSILPRRPRGVLHLPIEIPDRGDWLVRVLATEGRFVFGEYRRAMKTIGCLGRLDELFGVPATTRNWNTIRAILEILRRTG